MQQRVRTPRRSRAAALRRWLAARLPAACGVWCLLSLLASDSRAATITRLQSCSGASNALATSVSCTLPSTATAGNLFVVIVTGSGASGPVSFSAGNAGPDISWQSTAQASTGGNLYTQIFYAVLDYNEDHVAISVGSSVSMYLSMTLIEYAGVRNVVANAIDAVKSGAGSGTSASSGATATLVQPDEVAVGAIVDNVYNGTINSATGGFTLVSQQTSASGTSGHAVAFLEQIVTSTAALTAGATVTSGAWIANVITLRAATRYWQGGTTSWSTGNFGMTPTGACCARPTALETVVLSGSNTNNLTIDANITVNGFLVRSGYTGTVNFGSSTLTDNGDFDLSGAATVTASSVRSIISGSLTKSAGTFSHNNGKIVLRAAAAATIPAISYYDLRAEGTSETGLVGYWKFDEPTGLVAKDSSGNRNDGTTTSAMCSGNVPSALSFFENPCSASFNGTSDSISMGFHSLPDLGANKTLAVWVYKTTSNDVTISGMESATPEFIDWRFNSDGIVVNNGGSAVVYTASAPSINAWHHLAYTFDGTTHTLYVDGASAATSTSATAGGVIDNFYIGADALRTAFFTGQLDDYRVYSRALSATEIANLYAGHYASATLGVPTQTLAGATTVSHNLYLDGGILDVASTTLNASLTTAQAVVNAGKLNVGAGTINLSGGLFVKSLGTLNWSGAGVVNVTTGKTLNVDGTISTVTGANGTLQGSGGNYAFTINSDTSNPTAVVNIDGLSIKNTDTNGMNVQKATSSTFTKLQNVAFSGGTGARYLAITGDNLLQSFPGITFDAATSSNVVVSGTGSRYYFEDRGTNGAGAGEARDSDDDTTAIASAYAGPDGLADSGGSVVQWIWSAPTDLAGSAAGFPTAAFDWTTYVYYSTYVAMNNVDGAGTGKIYVRDANGADATYSATIASSYGTIVGTPRWDTIGGTRYVWVATSSGYVFKFKDDTSLKTLTAATGWSTPYRQGANATVTSNLLVNSSYVYWEGSNTSSSPTLFRIAQDQTGLSTQPITATVNAAMTLDNPSASVVVFSGTAGHVFRHDGTNLGSSPVDNTTLNPSAISGRIAVLQNYVYMVDAGGKVTVAPTSGFASNTSATWTYQDGNTGDHTNGCPTNANCQAQNFYVNLDDYYATGGNPRVVFGDKDGHVYLVRRNGSTSGATLFTNYPYQANGDTGTVSSAPLYQSGILVCGNDSGNLYVIDALTASGGTPKLIQAYKFGSAVTSVARNASTNGNAGVYMVATASGRMYYISASSDPSGSFR